MPMSRLFGSLIGNHAPYGNEDVRRGWRLALALRVFALLGFALVPASALADLVLSEVIVDFGPDQPPRRDIEVFNDGAERVYLIVQPAEIKAPGTAMEARRESPDPEALGLLVTPNRLVLEPGQRKLVRIAALNPPDVRDRIYRVTFKPVVGATQATTSGLKILVGYDVLVILRPTVPQATITATRTEQGVVLTNEGNTNAELFDGRQCDAQGTQCVELPAKRLYAGASWVVPLPLPTPVRYRVKAAGRLSVEQF
jgi:Mat/Ecp fimbriae periplasmic chaperone